MRSGLIDVSFFVPDRDEIEDGHQPHIYINATDLLDDIAEKVSPADRASLIEKQHRAETDFTLLELLLETVGQWDAKDQHAVCEGLAQYLEAVAEELRTKAESLSMNLRPRMSPGFR